MATLSKKKRDYIKERSGKDSTAEIAKALDVSEREVEKELRRMDAELEKERNPGVETAWRPHSIRWVVGVSIVLAIITALVYGRTMNYDFVFDDHHAILDNDPLHDIANLSRAFTDPSIFSDQPGRRMYRPIVTASYILNWAINGKKPTGWRLVDVLLQLCNCILLFLLLDLYVSRREIAAIISVAFAAHPAASEAVIFIAARSTIAAAFFVLIALYCFSMWCFERRKGWMIGTCVAYALGLLCKENVIMLAAILPVLYWLNTGATLRDMTSKAALKAFIAPLIVTVAYLLLRRIVFNLPTAVLSRGGRSVSTQIFTQAGVWWIYLRTMFWPIGLNVYRAVDVSKSVIAPGAGFFGQPVVWMLGWIVMAAVVILTRKNRMAFFGAFFCAIILLPETLTSLNLITADRRLYMPLIGLAFIAASPFRNEERGRQRSLKSWKIGYAVIIGFFIILSEVHVFDWRTEKALFQASIRQTPRSEISWHGLAYVFAQESLFDKSEYCLKQGLAIKPNYAASMRLLGAIYIQKKKLPEALEILEKSVKIEPLAQRGWYNLGLAQMQLGRRSEAIASFNKSIEQDPYYAQPHNNLGVIYEERGMYREAEKHYMEAVRLEPQSQMFAKSLERIRAKIKSPAPENNPVPSIP